MLPLWVPRRTSLADPRNSKTPPRRYTLSKKTMEALNTRGQTSSKLESLPAELLTEVLKMLTWKDVLQLRAVSCSGSK